MLTNDQTVALAGMSEFLNSRHLDLLVEGGAGTGKTWLVSHFLQNTDLRGRRWVACAFTNKATNVLRQKFTEGEVPWCPANDVNIGAGFVLTGTTSQLLGFGPTNDGDTKGTSRNFTRIMQGLFERVAPDVVVIDEVSMLANEHMQALRDLGRRYSCKLIAVGDAGQLPPVKAKGVSFDSFAVRLTLREIVRQAADSAIIRLGWAIRNGEPWEQIDGPGIRHTETLVEDFLGDVTVPQPGGSERERSVFVAYTNRRVDFVQERACRKLYGHGHGVAAPGEIIVAEAPFSRMCANQEELFVTDVQMGAATIFAPSETSLPDVKAHKVTVEKKRQGPDGLESITFTAPFLTKEERLNKHHPFNEITEALRAAALRAAERVKSHGGAAAEIDKKKAWGSFYRWQEGILTFRHPFAFTSHKSQGSTYRRVFADTDELAGFGREALYVAVTRASDELVMPKPAKVFQF